MTQRFSKKSLLVATMMAGALLTTPSMAATQATGAASATVVAAASITTNTAMLFGNIYNTDTDTCTLAPNDNSLTGSACASSTGTAGIFDITGTATTAIDITITGTTLTANDVTFAPSWWDGSTVVTALTGPVTTDGAGTFTLQVGGTLTNGPGVVVGTATVFGYTVDVAYQ